MSIHVQFGHVRAAGAVEELWPGFRDALRRQLGPLLSDPTVADTLERRGPLSLYELLRQRRHTGRLTDRTLVRSLLARNELFVLPVRRLPSLITFNGLGVRLVNTRADGTDGRRVLTHFVTVLFLPVCPIGQYLARPGADNEWEILGRIPLRTGHRVWQLAAWLVVIVAVGLLASFVAMAMARR